jgi:hypothetical protein
LGSQKNQQINKRKTDQQNPNFHSSQNTSHLNILASLNSQFDILKHDYIKQVLQKDLFRPRPRHIHPGANQEKPQR